VNLLRRDATGLTAQEGNDRPPGAASPPARFAQALQCALGPCSRHDDNDIRSQRRASLLRAMRPDRGLFCVVGAVLVLAAGCGSTGSGKGKTTVVAGFYPLAWAAQQIGGNAVDVHNLTPPGAEPHDIELTPRDVDEVRNADLVLYLGRGFQPALEKAVAGRSGPSLDLLAGQRLTSSIPGEGELSVDPHVWLDPVRFARMITAVGRELGRPTASAALAARLRALDAAYRSGLASCGRHEIVTSHAAFGYLARRYGLRQVALTGLAPEAEPSPKDLQALIDDVVASGATTVFFEPLVSPKLAQTVAREARVATAVLDPLEGLTDDDLAAGDDYFSVMRRNLATLRKALGCR
jgi:zinc transport system substrate-binding protein